MNLDFLAMLVLSLLLLSGGEDVQTAEVVFAGEHEVTAHRGALIVGDAEVTVPAGVEVPGPIHVLGGEMRIDGLVDGDVTQLGGRLIVADGATITGHLREIGGTLIVSPGAVIDRRSSLALVPTPAHPVQRILPVALLTALLAAVGGWRTRRSPRSLENLRRAVTRHPVVSVTVGGLMTVTFLALFVFMAFTLILLPVSLLGLAVGLLMVGYGVVALGGVVARYLPIEPPGWAVAAGVVIVMVLFQILGLIPLLGDLILGGLLLAGLGAVVLTYFGLREFTPVRLPD